VLSAAALAVFSLDITERADGVTFGVFLFTALVVSELSARWSRERRAAQWLAEEQAALRRVATLVARGLPPTEIVAAVAEEAGRLVAIDGTRILRYEADGTATVIAGWSESVDVASRARGRGAPRAGGGDCFDAGLSHGSTGPDRLRNRLRSLVGAAQRSRCQVRRRRADHRRRPPLGRDDSRVDEIRAAAGGSGVTPL